MYNSSSTLLVLLIALLFSCRNDPYINTFDAHSWQSDANGCLGQRLAQLGLVMDEQDELVGWSESKLTSYLGKPDHRELYVRNQKFLVYYIEPNLDCGNDGKDNPLRMYVRIDALGQSKEISLKNR